MAYLAGKIMEGSLSALNIKKGALNLMDVEFHAERSMWGTDYIHVHIDDH